MNVPDKFFLGDMEDKLRWYHEALLSSFTGWGLFLLSKIIEERGKHYGNQ